jgi:DNA-binding NarL/FixJ family response regulator
VLSALRMGAHGYVLKGIDGSALRAIVLSVAAGDSYVSPSLAARILAELRSPGPDSGTVSVGDPLASLTSREEQILSLVAEGRSNKEIARQIGLQEKTVKHHMTSILQKLDVRNRTEAAIVLAESRRV